MSDNSTARLQLPYLAAAQAQKHVTLNEALGLLDGLVQTAVESRTLTAEPVAPADGALYLLPPGRSGPEWSLHPEASLLRFDAGAWTRLAAPDGLIAYVRDETRLILRQGGAWNELGATLGAVQNLERLGLGAAADAVNPFTARLNKLLFSARGTGEGGDGGLRLTLNKQTTANVLSLLFQTGYSGRAELGLIGDDALSLKTSADGTSFVQALTVLTSGAVGLGERAPASRLTVGANPPSPGALAAVSTAGGVSLALSDNVNGSLYVRHTAGGSIIGTDPGGTLHLASAGHDLANLRVSVDAAAGVGESAMVLWVDTGSGLIGYRVSLGAPDSAGAGYRALRVSN